MNIIKVYGGLGNQMFQYAFGKALEANGFSVRFDLNWFAKSQTDPRPYGLDKFHTNVVQSVFLTQPVIYESENWYYRFNPEYLKKDNTNFFGYWQNRNYVNSVLPLLKKEFKVKALYYTPEFERIKAQILIEESSIALHIRRGDYLTKGHHLLPLKYYSESLTKVNGKLFIFSDDLEWCKNYFSDAVFVDVEDYLCLELMRCCTHKITANSTFSWWAGILGEKEESKTFAPARWRLNDTEEEAVKESEFIPSNWIRL